MSEKETNPSHLPDLPPPEGAAEAAVAGDTNTRRRRFLTQGLIGGPVALYVAGRPVKSLAWHDACTYSAYRSALGGTTSLTHTGCILGAGYMPSHYNPNGSTSPSTWPSGYGTGKYSSSNNNYYVHSGYTCTAFNDASLGFPTSSDNTLMSNILMTDNPPDEALFIAALFSALKGYTAEDIAGFVTYLKNTLYPYFVANPSEQPNIRIWLNSLDSKS